VKSWRDEIHMTTMVGVSSQKQKRNRIWMYQKRNPPFPIKPSCINQLDGSKKCERTTSDQRDIRNYDTNNIFFVYIRLILLYDSTNNVFWKYIDLDFCVWILHFVVCFNSRKEGQISVPEYMILSARDLSWCIEANRIASVRLLILRFDSIWFDLIHTRGSCFRIRPITSKKAELTHSISSFRTW